MGRETVNTDQAAQQLGVSQATVTRMWRLGELDGYKLRPNVSNSPLRIYVESVETILAKRAEMATS